jgi:lipopolysaccharide transport system ATP-binding protein
MQARLGFSVAAFMDPDVLFVDEVLSVGDMSFQARCLERMREQIREGVTVVFVSHHLQAVSELCERTLVFGSGTLLFDGPPADAIDVYLQASQTSSQRYNTQPKFRLVSSEFVRADGSPAHTISPHEPCRLDMVLECVEECPPVTVGVEIERTRDLFYCYGAASEELGIPRIAARPGDRVAIGIRFTAHFARGHYRLNVNLRDPDGQRFHFFAENAAHFTVAELVSYAGVVDVDLAITVADGRDALEGVGLTTAGLQGPSGRPA